MVWPLRQRGLPFGIECPGGQRDHLGVAHQLELSNLPNKGRGTHLIGAISPIGVEAKIAVGIDVAREQHPGRWRAQGIELIAADRGIRIGAQEERGVTKLRHKHREEDRMP